MKSPFPGMDPYIEARGLWPDFHGSLIGEIKRHLSSLLPERYYVRIEERSYIVLAGTDEKIEHKFHADVGIKIPEKGPSRKEGETAAALTAVATEKDFYEMRPFIEEEFRETFIEIYQSEPELRLVTTLEVLSPSNKRKGTEGWDLYLRKRQAQLLGAANLVEIDLLRGGQRMPMLDPWPGSPYTLLVSRMHSISHRCRVWPAFSLRPLPIIPVPLDRPDADVPLNLQPMIETVYAQSRYAMSINYSKPPTLPMNAEEIAWMQQHLPQPRDSAQPG